jgi:hypothetical protein
MKWTLIFRDDGILEIKAFGNFTNMDLIFMAEQIISNPRWKPGMDAVADFRSVSSYGIKLSDLFMASNIHKQFENMAGKGRVAVILGDNVSMLLSHAYKIIASMYMKIKLRSFKNYDDAYKWISGDMNYRSVLEMNEEVSGPYKHN